VSLPVLSLSDQRLQRRRRAKGGVFAFAPTVIIGENYEQVTTKLVYLI
jgi:hypothetical protein